MIVGFKASLFAERLVGIKYLLPIIRGRLNRNNFVNATMMLDLCVKLKRNTEDQLLVFTKGKKELPAEYLFYFAMSLYEVDNLDQSCDNLEILFKLFSNNSSICLPDIYYKAKNLKGLILIKRKKYAEAIIVFKSILDGLKKMYLYDHSLNAMCLHNLGLAYQSSYDYEQGMNYFRQALSVDFKVYGDYTQDSVMTYLELGITSILSKNNDDGERYLLLAHRICEVKNYYNDVFIKISKSLGELYCKKDMIPEARMYVALALKFGRERLMEDNPVMIQLERLSNSINGTEAMNNHSIII